MFSCGYGTLYEPSPDTGGEKLARFLEEKVLFHALDHCGIAVARATLSERRNGMEISDRVYLERSSIRSGDRARQHIARGIKVRIHFYIYFFHLLSHNGSPCLPASKHSIKRRQLYRRHVVVSDGHGLILIIYNEFRHAELK